MNVFGIILTCVFSFVDAQDIVFPATPTKSCRSISGERGWCQPLNRCPSAVHKLNHLRIKPMSCGFQRRTPLVCCPLSTDSANGTVRIIASDEVSPPRTNFECGKRKLISEISFRGRRSPRPSQPENTFFVPGDTVIRSIAGGIASSRNAWPWMALLGRKRGPSESFFCSGALINRDFVLTAAHCLLDSSPFFARFGEHDYKIEDGENIDESVEDIAVESVIFHPSYDVNQGYYDIALLKLQRAISLRDQVKPICLPWGRLAKEDLVNEEVAVAGWGREEFGGLQSTVLREVNVTIFDPSTCQRSYSTLKNFKQTYPEGLKKDNIICAGDINGEKDACQGDSGGPMMHYERGDGTFSLAGIISKGFGCGLKEFPGLYTPLRNFHTMQWIKDVAFP